MQLGHLIGAKSAAQDGVMMFDPVAGLPVFSRAGVWVPVAAWDGRRVESGISPAGVITFGAAFAAPPVVLVQPVGSSGGSTTRTAEVTAVSASGFTARIMLTSNAYGEAVKPITGDVAWLAVGL